MSTPDSEKLNREEAVDLLASLPAVEDGKERWVKTLEKRFEQIRDLEPDEDPGLLSLALGYSGKYPYWQRMHTIQTVIERLSHIAKGLDSVKVNDRWGLPMTKDEAMHVIRDFGEYGTNVYHFGVETAFTQARFHSTGNAVGIDYSQELVISCLKRSLGISGNWRDVSILSLIHISEPTRPY